MKKNILFALCLAITVIGGFDILAQCPTPNWGTPILKNDNGTAVTLPVLPNKKYKLEITLNAPAPTGLVRIDIVSADGFGYILGVNPDGSDGDLQYIPPGAIGKDVAYNQGNPNTLIVPVKVTFNIKTFPDLDLGPNLYFRYRGRCSPISGGTYQYGPNTTFQIATGR